jgi:ABC-2 type transport system ATP-binding protein
MTTTPAIETRALSKRYGERAAVNELSLRVERGEIFGLLGPNGAGKTTTIAMLLGLVRPTSGEARVLGHDIAHEPAAALRQVGAMIEGPAFYPYLSGYDNLMVLVRAGGLAPERIETVLRQVELSQRARDKVRTYSHGMRQRLAIAAALLPDPELVILDEPTNGLDPAGTAEIRSLIRTLAAHGRTVVLCSHMLHEVEQLCGRVAILKEGQLIALGQVAELLHRGQGLRVRIEGDVARALQLVRELPWVASAQQEGDVLLIDGPASKAAELNAHLAAAGVLVAEIGARSGSLEDYFLDITGES